MEPNSPSGYANGQPFPSLGSCDKPQQQADGSIELCLGPTAPLGKDRNWMKTIAGRACFTILRLYGPTEAAINGGWKPSDIEQGR